MRLLVAIFLIGGILASGCSKTEVTEQDVENWSKAEGGKEDEPEAR